MEFLDTMRMWIDKNANWIKIFLLILLVLKACICHRELVTLLGGGMLDNKHKHHNGGGMGHHHKKTKSFWWDKLYVRPYKKRWW